jgi:Amiloride-sensitive sodium channel
VHNEQPYRVAGAGRGSGLAVVLDLGTEHYMTASRPFYGSEIIIHDSNDFPQTSFSTTIVQPGYVAELMITPTLIESQEIIENVAIEQRRCYLKAEKKLRTTNHYSFKSCITECRVDRIQQICRCVPFYYPETDLVEFAYSSRVCTLADVQCLYENRREDPDLDVESKGLINLSFFPDVFSSIKPEVNVTGLSESSSSGLVCEGCLPSCSRQSYLVSQALAARNFNNAGKVKRV